MYIYIQIYLKNKALKEFIKCFQIFLKLRSKLKENKFRIINLILKKIWYEIEQN